MKKENKSSYEELSFTSKPIIEPFLLAIKLWKKYKIKSFKDIEKLSNFFNIEITKDYKKFANTGISGISCNDDGQSFIVINSTKHELHQQFTHNHELGHLLLHSLGHEELDNNSLELKVNSFATLLSIITLPKDKAELFLEQNPEMIEVLKKFGNVFKELLKIPILGICMKFTLFLLKIPLLGLFFNKVLFFILKKMDNNYEHNESKNDTMRSLHSSL